MNEWLSGIALEYQKLSYVIKTLIKNKFLYVNIFKDLNDTLLKTT